MTEARGAQQHMPDENVQRLILGCACCSPRREMAVLTFRSSSAFSGRAGMGSADASAGSEGPAASAEVPAWAVSASAVCAGGAECSAASAEAVVAPLAAGAAAASGSGGATAAGSADGAGDAAGTAASETGVLIACAEPLAVLMMRCTCLRL
jgi:hypothetical protein